MCLALLGEKLGNVDVRVRLNMATYHALEERGLVYWVVGDLKKKQDFGGLTQEGSLVAELLLLAGMTVEALLPSRWE
jgi:UDP-N-acetylmuramoylalanine-D-glutamate ligase